MERRPKRLTTYIRQRTSIWDASGTLLHEQIYWGSTPVAFFSDGPIYYHHQDWLGTERMRTTYNGTVEGSYQSLPFGDGLSTAGSDNDAYHFAGLDHDPETDTDYAWFRQYGTSQGRWMSPDPYNGSYDLTNPQSLNRYAYVLNNPMVYFDPYGLRPPSSYGSGGVSYGEVCSSSGEPGDTVSATGADGTTVDPPTSVVTCELVAQYSGFLSPVGGLGPQFSGATNNGPTVSHCLGAAGQKNGVALSLDVAGIGAGFLPGGDLVVAGAQMGIGVASTVNSSVGGDVPGAVTGVFGFQLAAMVPAAKWAGMGAKAIPFLGTALSVASTVRDAAVAYGDYQTCMAGQ